MQNATNLAGRILLALIFIMSGIGKIPDFANTADYMASRGMPLVTLLLVGAIIFELLGGLLVATGFKARLGAILLIIFLVPASLIFHNFWAYPEEQQKVQMIMFMKNLAIMGGLLIVTSRGPGSLSVGRAGSEPDTEES